MSRNFFWDLGFDFNAVQAFVGDLSYLESGFVLGGDFTISTTGVPGTAVQKFALPATPVGLGLGDQITFNVFNTTALGANEQPGDFSIVAGSINFSAAEGGGGAVSPFNVSGTSTPQDVISMNTSAQMGQAQSVVFDGVQAPDPAGGLPTLPIWTVAGPLSIANKGRFQMRINLTVQGPTGRRTFVVDPEMVVGSVG